MKPIIGIIICGTINSRQFVTESYIKAIVQSHGIPILIPCSIFQLDSIASDQLNQFYAAYYKYCDGFLFCGGDDISPLLFNESPFDSSGTTDIKMDLFQISFMEFLLNYKKPILGICRGMQLMNVALCGTLYQDLSLRNSATFCHMQNSSTRSEPFHQIYISENSKLFNITGFSVHTNSFHHQAIHKLGSDIIACGHTKDGVIEAIEITSHPFAIGVQWHPECMYDISTSSRKLFHEFIKQSVLLLSN